MISMKALVEKKEYSNFMLLSIMCYAFFSIGFHHIGNFFLGLIICGTLPLLFIKKEQLFKNSIIILFFLIILLQVLSWMNSLFFLPECANRLPKVDRLAKLFTFFFIAYWLKGNIKYILFLWLFFTLGFLFTIFFHADFNMVFEAIQTGKRVDFLIKNSQFDSMIAGVVLLMVLFSPYLVLKAYNISKNWTKIVYLFFWLTFSVLFIYIVLITQSRQVWLGLFISLCIGILTYMYIYKMRNWKLFISGLIILTTLLIFIGNLEFVKERLSLENDTIHSLVIREQPIKMSSIGIRVNSWLEAKTWIIHHPILGLDSVAIAQVIQRSNKFSDELKEKFGHLHNFFIETLVAYGVVGLFLILTLYFLVVRSIEKSNLDRNIKSYFLLVGITFLTYWLVINNFETFNSRRIGVSIHNIILASLYTFYLSDFFREKNKQLI